MEYYLYNLYTKEAQPLDLGEYISVGLGAEKHVTFCINELEEIIFGGEFYVTTEGFSDFEDSGAVTINGNVFSSKSLRYINNRTGKIEEVDYYIPNGSRIFAANNNCHYAVDSKYENIYMVDTTGEYEFLLSVDDIDNVDKRKIDLTKLDKSHSIPNSVVDNNGIIYFYDKEYGCVRCIRKK